MDEELVRKLDDLARLRGISRSALIKEILSVTLDRASASPVRKAALALRTRCVASSLLT
ncbi:ribbon-helix-helix protein, CopG family [Candidatus Bipolaricaulota bacterium]|nr:ribbon-helix-helix protein, CopG family [Candidatus Bipolaricaulota bacterium]